MNQNDLATAKTGGNTNSNHPFCHVKINSFDGPLELFYEMIKSKKMDIMSFDLLELINQYVTYIHTYLEQIEVDYVTDYLLICTGLLELKSKMILPTISSDRTAAEEMERDMFIQNLLVYKQYQNLIPTLESRMQVQSKMRPVNGALVAKPNYAEHFYAEPNPEQTYQTFNFAQLDLHKMLATMQKIYLKLQTIRPKRNNQKMLELEAYEIGVETVENEILTFLAEQPAFLQIALSDYFYSLPPNKISKQYFVIVFVALLVLVKNQVIELIQEDENNDLYLVKINSNQHDSSTN